MASEATCDCCVGSGCGECLNCYSECEHCNALYDYVKWPEDETVEGVRRFMCTCKIRAQPSGLPGHRAICGKCKCFIYHLYPNWIPTEEYDENQIMFREIK